MTLVTYTHNFLTSLVFTCATETLVLYLALRFALKSKGSLANIIFAGIFASFATITYVWYVFPVVATWPAHMPQLYSEPFAFIVEAIFYHFFLRLRWRDAFMVSLAANLVSYFAGPLLRTVGMWVYW